MSKTGFIYSDIFLKHIAPWGHPEKEKRLEKIVESVKKSGLWEKLDVLSPKNADFSDIAKVHTSGYIEKMKNLKGAGHLDGDTYFCEDSVEVALHAAGSIMQAIEKCKKGDWKNGFCAVRPPGHHAEAGYGMGFCLFNNIAVGARYAQTAGFDRPFIVDFDVHHGNGSQNMFYDDNTVFYFSTHQYPHYPGSGSEQETGSGKGKGYTRNIPLPGGSGDEEYQKIYNDILPSLVKEFKPDILLVSAGYDLSEYDPLSGIEVSHDGIRSIVRGILKSQKDIPCVFTLEGGYNLKYLGELVVITLEEMMKP